MLDRKNDDGVFFFDKEDGVRKLRRQRAWQDLYEWLWPVFNALDGLPDSSSEGQCNYERFTAVPPCRFREFLARSGPEDNS